MKRVFIHLTTKAEKAGDTTTRTITAEILINHETTTRQIFEFVKQAKKIEREAIKAVKAGTFSQLDLCEIRNKASERSWIGTVNEWTCENWRGDVDTTAGEESFYFHPGENNENPNFDILVPFGKLTDELNI